MLTDDDAKGESLRMVRCQAAEAQQLVLQPRQRLLHVQPVQIDLPEDTQSQLLFHAGVCMDSHQERVGSGDDAHFKALVPPCVAGPERGVVGAAPQLAVFAVLPVCLLPPRRRRRLVACAVPAVGSESASVMPANGILCMLGAVTDGQCFMIFLMSLAEQVQIGQGQGQVKVGIRLGTVQAGGTGTRTVQCGCVRRGPAIVTCLAVCKRQRAQRVCRQHALAPLGRDFRRRQLLRRNKTLHDSS